MRHVAPHKWAAADDGRLTPGEVAKLERHAEGCVKCRVRRARVLAIREPFADISEATPRPLKWEHVGARIYWVTSSERRATQRMNAHRRPQLTRRFLAASFAAVVAGAATWFAMATWGGDTMFDLARVSLPSASEPQPRIEAPEVKAIEQPARMAGVVTLAQGEVGQGPDFVSAQQLIDSASIGEGSILRTGRGQVAVQFAEGSAFRLDADSEVRIVRFRHRDVELAVQGTIVVDLVRHEQQRFVVAAGDRKIVVRGTAFRVDNRDGALEVVCVRGRVSVRAGGRELDVSAGHRLVVERNLTSLVNAAVAAITAGQQLEYERAVQLPMLSSWTTAGKTLVSSSTLAVDAPVGRLVRVDGVEVGQGAMLVRVDPGRHHVEAQGAKGWEQGHWLSVQPGAVARARIATSPKPATVSPKRRRTELVRAVRASARLRQCLRPRQKQGVLRGSYLALDIGIESDGSVGHLNILRTNLPDAIAACVRDAVDAIAFKPGPKASFRHRLSF